MGVLLEDAGDSVADLEGHDCDGIDGDTLGGGEERVDHDTDEADDKQKE